MRLKLGYFAVKFCGFGPGGGVPRFVHKSADVRVFNFWRVLKRVKLECSFSVHCGSTHFRGQIWGDFSAMLEERAGMANTDTCGRNPFARDVFRPKAISLQILREI